MPMKRSLRFCLPLQRFLHRKRPSSNFASNNAAQSGDGVSKSPQDASSTILPGKERGYFLKSKFSWLGQKNAKRFSHKCTEQRKEDEQDSPAYRAWKANHLRLKRKLEKLELQDEIRRLEKAIERKNNWIEKQKKRSMERREKEEKAFRAQGEVGEQEISNERQELSNDKEDLEDKKLKSVDAEKQELGDDKQESHCDNETIQRQACEERKSENDWTEKSKEGDGNQKRNKIKQKLIKKDHIQKHTQLNARNNLKKEAKAECKKEKVNDKQHEEKIKISEIGVQERNENARKIKNKIKNSKINEDGHKNHEQDQKSQTKTEKQVKQMGYGDVAIGNDNMKEDTNSTEYNEQNNQKDSEGSIEDQATPEMLEKRKSAPLRRVEISLSSSLDSLTAQPTGKLLNYDGSLCDGKSQPLLTSKQRQAQNVTEQADNLSNFTFLELTHHQPANTFPLGENNSFSEVKSYPIYEDRGMNFTGVVMEIDSHSIGSDSSSRAVGFK